MKQTLAIILLVILSLPLCAQIRLNGIHQEQIHPALFKDEWNAQWISVPDEPVNAYGIYHFRKSFDIASIPSQFIVHVSADNRYKLYINGNLVSLGPARCDVLNWNFETLDLAPYLKTGNNVLAAIVWNYAEQKPVAQISYNQTGFILQGNTQTEEIVNTDKSWKCLKNTSYSPWNEGKVMGYYVAGPGELMNANTFPWEWENIDYDDSFWKTSLAGIRGAMKGTRDYPGRLLVPSPIPPMEMKIERFSTVRISEGIKPPADFLRKPTSFVIPAKSSVHLLLDNENMITGYLSIQFNKGLNAEITIGYAEALYELSNNTKSIAKGNRNDIEGKTFHGYEDKIIADGGEHRNFTSLWWRTWRYAELKIETASEPLVIDDIYGTLSAYPFIRNSEFEAAGHPELNKMLDIGWLTARLCANETYMDCPYYEQLQYFGDTRIQTMISLYNTNDAYMVKNAIEQGHQSIVADGIMMSRYPTNNHQFISSYSLCWIGMGYDYWMHRSDETYLKSLLPAYRGILSWYEQWLKPDYSLDYVPHWFFADWSDGFPNGEPIREKEGNSAFQDIKYIMTLDEAAAMEQAFGLPAMAAHYRDIALKIRETIRQKYWNDQRKMFADTHDHRNYSQHVNTLAILAGIVTRQEAADLITQVLTDDSLTKSTIYFRYYVHQALAKAGLGDQLLDNLDIWHDQMALGLTTWAEMPEPSRSDCHAWGASLNIEFFRIILGIKSNAPGFKEVRIAPSLGDLKNVSGSIPHPQGSISVCYTIDKKERLTAMICLPEGVSGDFIWKGKSYPLNAGEQTIHL